MTANQEKKIRVALLYQAIEPPVINGVRKPMKPGGYQDSGADIAFALQSLGIEVLTPEALSDPSRLNGWCFPDTEEGILSALQKGATHLWANTILFSAHPLQATDLIAKYQDNVRVIGQPPNFVEQFDDKEHVNNLLRKQGKFTLPKGWTIHASNDVDKDLADLDLPFPIVGKPIRGRGSYGVKVCHSLSELQAHAASLLQESSSIMLEEYLSGQEGTVSVMPPSEERPDYWAMPIVTRFNHHEGIAPYNGTVAVTANSRVITKEEYTADPRYAEAAKECEEVAWLLKVTAPMRIDIRRFTAEAGSKFALFDVNVKPNMTGPGRPGREDQACLTALAAAELGWDYPRLLQEMLKSSQNLRLLRGMKPSN